LLNAYWYRRGEGVVRSHLRGVFGDMGRTVPEVVDRRTLEQDEEEVEGREGRDGHHGGVDDDLVDALEAYPDDEDGDGETDEDGREGIEDPR
jgi:hypothetical protein